MTGRTYPLGLFEGYGIEIEYMIVDRETLDVRPIIDRVLEEVGGPGECEVAFDRLAWSNELVLHVIEVKTNGTAPELDFLAGAFHSDVVRINAILANHGAMLMPTAMHPWMDPETETRLWPHEYGEAYDAFDRIFDCRGHGWSNLQSVHINFPFRNDEEFGRLHAAIRMVLPILPALAASSPLVGGEPSGLVDTRLDYYRRNCRKVPSVTGHVIPEQVFAIAEYEGGLLERLYRDIAPLDPEGVLRHEWLNARGAIARFDRGAIEIRLLDVQECPRADMAVVTAVVSVVRALARGEISPPVRQRSWSEQSLEEILLDAIRYGPDAVIGTPAYLRDMGMDLPPDGQGVRARDLWKHLVARHVTGGDARDVLDGILAEGCLAERILRAVAAGKPGRAGIATVYRTLAACLASNLTFDACP
jgi:gamma-glutamyl:cysteine ligase YbdK (ATP-grasp superfamily)